MTTPNIELKDLDQLTYIYPDLDFTDDERRTVLLEMLTRDIQAAPGSGKTTLIAAKLLLLAQHWPHTNRGICVISHTNVARGEIIKRLSQTPTGSRLLSYPHFIGTIHAFVNQFLALPILRSLGITVDVIDNDVFAEKAISLLSTKNTLKAWVDKNPNQGRSAIATLRYEGPDLSLGWEAGNLPAPGSNSHSQAKALKEDLTKKGIFRHEDMFAFAELLLQNFPEVSNRISYRFPFVLIDEMQDTSWEQEQLLAKIFSDTVIMQRYGDRNQRILSSSNNSEKLSFPKVGFLNIRTTKRFSENIAATVRAVQEHGEPISAVNIIERNAPVLMLYDIKNTQNVIQQFGSLVLHSFGDDLLQSSSVKAICARKQGEAKQEPGRHLVDYWPSYSSSSTTKSGQESIYNLLIAPAEMGVLPTNIDIRARSIKRALLLILRAVQCAVVKDIRDATGLIRGIEAAGVDANPIRLLCRNLSLTKDLTSDNAWDNALIFIFNGLSFFLPKGMAEKDFIALPLFERPLTTGTDVLSKNECVIFNNERSVRIQISTIAAVKGETHLATLVLESYGLSKKFDLETALSNISQASPIDKKASDSLRGQYRNLYVAISRPSHLLCLAMNKQRAPQDRVEELVAQGWIIKDISM